MTDELDLARHLLTGDLELLCTEMRLLSCPSYQDSLFDGTGLIRSKRGGRLSFEMVGRFEDGFPPLVRQPSVPHGQVPGADDHVMLSATDSYGREWRSNWIRPKAFPPSSSSHCWVVSAPVETLITSEVRPHADESKGRLYIRIPAGIPFDKATHTTKRAGTDEVESGWSLDHHIHQIGGATVEFREQDRELLSVHTRQPTPVMPTWAGYVCQALSFATTQTIRPAVAVREFSDRKHTSIFSGPFAFPRSFLPPPVPPSEKDDFWILIQKFVEWCDSSNIAAQIPLFDELAGIRNGSMGSIATASLTLAVAIEALTTLLLGEINVTRTSTEDVDDLLTHLRQWPGDNSIKERAASVVGSMKTTRAVDRLHAFAQNERLAPELVDAWKKLRDATAHGRTPAAAQPLYDRFFSTAELLYRMLGSALGYDGAILDTSRRGWGLDEWGFPTEAPHSD